MKSNGFSTAAVSLALCWSAAAAGQNGCPVHMVRVGPICVDQHEASVWSQAAAADGTPRGTRYGVDDDYPCSFTGNDCTNVIYAASVPGVIPSGFINWFQAQQACMSAGKRLPTNAEWQGAAAGTPDTGGADDGTTTCNTDALEAEGRSLTGSRESCVSNFGVFDMVGNVAESVADWTQGDSHPWRPTQFGTPHPGNAGEDFGDDLMFGVNPAVTDRPGSTFPSTLVRGAPYFSGTEAGVFALWSGPSPAAGFSDWRGFRCVR